MVARQLSGSGICDGLWDGRGYDVPASALTSKTKAMFTRAIFFVACVPLLGATVPDKPYFPDAGTAIVVGGPPAIRVAGKASGDITAAQWKEITQVDLVGCVPHARITSLTVCLQDCKGKDALASGKDASLTAYQRQMIANLPAGTPFSVRVEVRDEQGKAWEVPEARFVWKG